MSNYQRIKSDFKICESDSEMTRLESTPLWLHSLNQNTSKRQLHKDITDILSKITSREK